MKTIALEQMELTINGNRIVQIVDARVNREHRARWWFEKMRDVVRLSTPPPPAAGSPAETPELWAAAEK